MDRILGTHAVEEALLARRRKLHGLKVRHGTRADRVRTLAEASGVPVETLAPEVFDANIPEGARGRSQGVLLEAGALPTVSLEELVAARPAGGCCVAALDGLVDPQNVGSVARAADGAGLLGLVTASRRAAPLSPAASRASAGALEHLPVARAANLARALGFLKAHDFWILGADSKGGDDLVGSPDRMWEGNLVIVLGSEGQGLRPGIASKLDHRVRIPMHGAVASLNVASAASLLFYEWRRRRGPGPPAPDRG